MAAIITLTKDQQDLLKSSGNHILSGDSYYNLPQWFKETDKDGIFEVFFINELPDNVKQAAEKIIETYDKTNRR